MKPAAFAYYRATSAADAIARLAADEDAVFLSGGQSLVPMMNLRLARPSTLIDLNHCAELAGIDAEDGALRIGALTRHHAIATSETIHACNPLLAHAADSIGYYAIRQRGTIGGSLAHADPAAQWPLLAVLFGAAITLEGPEGSREVAAGDFFLSVFVTAREPGELITAVRFPALEPDAGWGFAQLCKVAGDFAIASAAAVLRLDSGGRIITARLAVGAVCDVPTQIDTTPILASPVEAGRLAAFADAAARSLAISDGAQATAAERRDLARTMIGRALTDAALRAQGRLA